ncbi:MAG: PKD domain-containing protein [Candidatus Omnitrophota bacterium]
MIRARFAIIIFVAALCLPKEAFAFTNSVSDYLYEYGVDRYQAGDIPDAIHELKKALIANPANDKARSLLNKITPSNVITTQVKINSSPVADAGKNMVCCAGRPSLFDGSNSKDADGDKLTYFWDFGDGTSTQGSKVTHTYNKAGQYMVTLTVRDGFGPGSLAAKSSFTAIVHEKPEAVIKIREK